MLSGSQAQQGPSTMQGQPWTLPRPSSRTPGCHCPRGCGRGCLACLSRSAPWQWHALLTLCSPAPCTRVETVLAHVRVCARPGARPPGLSSGRGHGAEPPALRPDSLDHVSALSPAPVAPESSDPPEPPLLCGSAPSLQGSLGRALCGARRSYPCLWRLWVRRQPSAPAFQCGVCGSAWQTPSWQVYGACGARLPAGTGHVTNARAAGHSASPGPAIRLRHYRWLWGPGPGPRGAMQPLPDTCPPAAWALHPGSRLCRVLGAAAGSAPHASTPTCVAS